MDKYQTTFATWDSLASRYQEKFMDLHLYDETYSTFCGLVAQPGANVLEIGCGPGNITRYLLSQRPDYRIDAIDVAPAMVKLAQANNPTARCQVMDAREIGRLPQKYEATLCGFCMPYLAKEDCAKLIQDCAFLLTRGGIFYFSTIEGAYEDSGWGTSSTGESMFLHYYQEAFFQEELKRNNFEVVEIRRVEYAPSAGTPATHLVIIARKR
jgi:2-polyprenyl-3-methyl-5-hydroxy-6-metoxy-1,4-benzoquinol methylase